MVASEAKRVPPLTKDDRYHGACPRSSSDRRFFALVTLARVVSQMMSRMMSHSHGLCARMYANERLNVYAPYM